MAFSLFPAFFDCPKNIRFADQEEDEKIELFLRQHGIVNVPWIFISILGAITPIILVNQSVFLELIHSWQAPNEIITSFFILWYMFILAYVINHLSRWYFNIYIVTNKHLVDVNFHNLLNRDFVEVRLDDVQSAKSVVQGIIGSLFHFGDLIIETAAERQQIHFGAVPKPDVVKERIQDLQEREENGDVT